MDFWPRKIELRDIFINSLWSFLAWVIGSVIMFFLVIAMTSYIDIVNEFEMSWSSGVFKTNFMFPIMFAFITFIGSSITMFLTNIMLRFTNPDNYKKNVIITWQIAFFSVFLLIFIIPIYINQWLNSYQNIIIVYLFHILCLTFAVSLIIEILNNYRHVLLGLYGSFVWLFFAIIFVLSVFAFLETGIAKLIALVVILPFVNMFMTFFKQLFDYLYYKYNRYANQDPLWDIFYKIELEEKELLKEEEEKNSI